MPKAQTPGEVELAAAAIGWLRRHGWTVYQEVQSGRRGPVADIVAVRGEELQVVECKRSLSLALLEQSLAWVGRADFVSIAVPGRRPAPRGYQLARDLLAGAGCGWLQVWSRAGGARFVTVRLHPERHEGSDASRLRACLHEQQQTWAAAGNARSERWSPFQETCANVRRAVAGQPGIGLSELVATIEHHYRTPRSARSAIGGWARRGAIAGVTVRTVAGVCRLYPAPVPSPPD